MATKGYKSRDTSSRESKYQLLTPFNREIAKVYISELERIKKDRANAYEGSILKFLMFIEIDLIRLVKDDIDRFVSNELNEKGNSISNINFDLGRIRNFLEFCIKKEKITDTPLKNYKNLKNDEEKAPTRGKSLSNEQLVKIESVLENPESIITMQGSIVWNLVYKRKLKGKELMECSSENYDLNTRTFNTSYGSVELDEKNGDIMAKLIGKVGKDFGFTQYISDKVLEEIGTMIGVENLNYRDIETTRNQFSFKCPECMQSYENKEGNWIVVHGRILCSECGEKLKKKYNIDLNFLSAFNIEYETVIHPLLHDNFDAARKKISFTIDDLLNQQVFQRSVGSLGERYVLDVEIKKLEGSGLVPRHIGDIDVMAGYDILSYDLEGNEIYIEVKSTVNVGRPFFMSEKEYWVAKEKKDRYYVYRVENVMASSSREVLLTKYNDPANNQKLFFEPQDWKVTILE